jgi:hypothetical protein
MWKWLAAVFCVLWIVTTILATFSLVAWRIDVTRIHDLEALNNTCLTLKQSALMAQANYWATAVEERRIADSCLAEIGIIPSR